MKLTITISMDNDAFAPCRIDRELEVGRILQDTDLCLDSGKSGKVRDGNGNTVGGWKVTR